LNRALFAEFRFRLGVVAGLIALTSCGSASDPGAGSVTGSYDVHWQRTAAVCSPVALPATTDNGSTNYLVPPARDSTWVARVDVGMNDTSFTFTLFDASGAKDPLGPYVGDTPAGPGVATRTRGPITEAARGAHVFSALATTSFNYYVMPLVLTPPGRGLEVDLQISSTTTYEYREPGATGAVFTTCVSHDIGSASR
jgi:hypothetical protein